MDDFTPMLTEEERAARRAQRAEARRQKLLARRRRRLMQLLPVGALAAMLVALLTAWAAHRQPEAIPEATAVPIIETLAQEPEPTPVFSPAASADTIQLGDDFASGYAVLLDAETGAILAEKNADAVISPASMTKILTLLVAAEHVTDLDDTVSITLDITDFCFLNDCSVVGFELGETVSVRDLLYGTILPSGADAALALATYAAGSQEAFVALMNDKLAELGLSDTAHFTNCVGVYHADHVRTVTDMAVILRAAMENDLCRQVLSAHTYETPATPEHPEGQILSNWFLRRIEDKDSDLPVRAVAAKTGYVLQSGNCAASYAAGEDGRSYLCVTANASSYWRAIYDHVELYKLCP